MDSESIVYGCIKDLPMGSDAEQRRRLLHNQNIISQLPGVEDWPFLAREMFSSMGLQPLNGPCQTQVIHFGSSYRSIEYEWQQWIGKFEQLLGDMYWESVSVHLQTELSGTHVFSWDAENNCHTPGSGGISVRCEWEHEGAF